MAPPFGVTSTGFMPMTLDEALQLVRADLQGIFGAGIDLSPQSNFGQLAGVMAERLADCYAMGADVYNAFTPDGAAAASLDFLNGLRGVLRLQAEPSTVQLTLTGAPSTPLALGRIVSTAIGVQFETTSAANLPAAAPGGWASSTGYAQGAVVSVTDRYGVHLYLATGGGVSSSAGGPSGYGSAILDNTVTWAYAGEAVAGWANGASYTAAASSGQLGQRVTSGGYAYLCTAAGPGAAANAPAQTAQGQSVTGADGYTWLSLGQGTVAIDVPCESVETGPQAAGAGALTSIVTPVSGWLSAYNVLEAALGQNTEMDDGGVPGPGYRLRAESEIRAGGAGRLEAIRSAVTEALDGLTPPVSNPSVQVYENTGASADSAWRPSGAVEVIVYAEGGLTATAQQAVAQAIFGSVGAGIQTVGQCTSGGANAGAAAVSQNVVDSQGNVHQIWFSIPAAVPVFVELTVYVNAAVVTEGGTYPNTQAAVEAIIAAFAANLVPGQSVTCAAILAAVFGLNSAGRAPAVYDVTGLQIGLSNAYGTTTYLPMTPWQYATIAAGAIVVTVLAGDL